MCFDFLATLFETFLTQKELRDTCISQTPIDPQVKYQLLLRDLNNTLIFLDNFSKNTQIFHENQSIGSRAVLYGQT